MIEREYRVGQFSVLEIARQNGISHTAINKMAKRRGWSRDLAPEVRREIKTRLAREVSSEVSAEIANEAIDHAARRSVEVIRHHRKMLGAVRDFINRLLSQLEADLNAENAVLRLLEHSRTLNRLVTAIKTIVELERKIYNLDEQPLESPLDQLRREISGNAIRPVEEIRD